MAEVMVSQKYRVRIGGCWQPAIVDKRQDFNGFPWVRVCLLDGSLHWMDESNIKPALTDEWADWPPPEAAGRPRRRFRYYSGRMGD